MFLDMVFIVPLIDKSIKRKAKRKMTLLFCTNACHSFLLLTVNKRELRKQWAWHTYEVLCYILIV